MHVIASSLFARFVSRQDDSPAMKAIAAMRNQFGGHALRTEAPEGGDAAGRRAGAVRGPQAAGAARTPRAGRHGTGES